MNSLSSNNNVLFCYCCLELLLALQLSQVKNVILLLLESVLSVLRSSVAAECFLGNKLCYELVSIWLEWHTEQTTIYGGFLLLMNLWKTHSLYELRQHIIIAMRTVIKTMERITIRMTSSNVPLSSLSSSSSLLCRNFIVYITWSWAL